MSSTKIEWCDSVWNPITGCSTISEGCKNCYARRMAKRLAGRFGYPMHGGFEVTKHWDKIDEPLRWRKPRTVFVCSMGDLFHEDVDEDFILRVFFFAQQSPKHTFIFLTKRPHIMFESLENWRKCNALARLPKKWIIGVTAENQGRADERIPILLHIPAEVRFVSVEPMLGPIIIDTYLRPRMSYPAHDKRGNPIVGISTTDFNHLDWVICGAETGPGARPMQLDWARSLRDQCQESSIPFFFKRDSSGNRELDGVIWEQFPQAK